MPPGSSRSSRRSRALVVAIAATTVLSAVGSASASTLGGLSSATMLSMDGTVTGAAPSILGCDDFDLPAGNGSALNGRPAQLPANCGQAVWTTHAGTWTVTGGQVRANNQHASASVAAGATDVSAQATVLNADVGGTRAAGVAIDHSGATRVFLAGVVVANDVAELRLVDGGTVTVVASAPAAVTASASVRLTRQGPTITLQVNGATALTYSLTPAQAATLVGTRSGLYLGRGNQVRFADFLVTQAAP